MKDSNKHWTFYMLWGRKASENEILLAAEDLLKQTQTYKLFLYLSIFQKRQFPLGIDSLISWARSSKKNISDKSLLVLRNNKSDAIHEFALELLQDENPHSYALELLVHNYQPQDLTFIERILLKKQTKHSFHHRALDVLHIFEENKDPSSIHLLLHIYNEGLCTYCREGFIDIMIANDWLPASIQDELVHDCNLDIREKVKQYKISGSDY